MFLPLEGTVSDLSHPPRPQPSPPLSAQVSSNGRDSCRTFLRIDGATRGGKTRRRPWVPSRPRGGEQEGHGQPLPQGPSWQRGRRAGAHTHGPKQRLCARRGVGHAKEVWAGGNCLEASPRAGLRGTTWDARGPPPCSFLVLSHRLPHLKSQRTDPLGAPHPGQILPKPWWVAPGRGAEGGGVWTRVPPPTPGQKQGPGLGRGGVGSLGSSQISVRASAGTRPRFLPLLTRMKPSASLLLPTPTQIWFSLRLM